MFDLVFVTSKQNLTALTKETWSFLGLKASRGSQGARGSAGIVVGSWTCWGSAEPYAGGATEVYHAAASIFTCNKKRKIKATSGLKDFRAYSWEVCFSVFAELQWEHLHCIDLRSPIQIDYIIVPYIFKTVTWCYLCGSAGAPLWEWQLTNDNGYKCSLDWNNTLRVNGHHY